MNTNFLAFETLSDTFSGEFLSEGALIQRSQDDFRLFTGPFRYFKTYSEAKSEGRPVLFSSKFWSFIAFPYDEKPFIVADRAYKMTRKQLKELLSFKSFLSKKNEVLWDENNFQNFKEQFSWIQKKIAENQFHKALPIHLQQGDLKNQISISEILKSILNYESVNFVYGLWNKQEGMVGYTPEVLSEWDFKLSQLKTMALAGTWKKNNQDSIPDFNDEKIKTEHQYVVSDIQKQLSSFKLLKQSETRVVELPYLFHLQTQFIFHCQNSDRFLEAVQQLHPTAALGLYPRINSEFDTLSKFDIQSTRGGFGAPFGYIDEEDALILVAIRNIFWNCKKVYLYTGCGVTADSQYEIEREEIIDKQDSVKKMLGIEN